MYTWDLLAINGHWQCNLKVMSSSQSLQGHLIHLVVPSNWWQIACTVCSLCWNLLPHQWKVTEVTGLSEGTFSKVEVCGDRCSLKASPPPLISISQLQWWLRSTMQHSPTEVPQLCWLSGCIGYSQWFLIHAVQLNSSGHHWDPTFLHPSLSTEWW